jgi:hypothetical protein
MRCWPCDACSVLEHTPLYEDPQIMRIVAKAMIRNKPDSYAEAVLEGTAPTLTHGAIE